MASRFWVGGNGNFSSTAHWAATSGGAGGQTVPGSADTVTIDSNSGSPTITIDQAVSVLSFSATSGISLSDHENTGKGVELKWDSNNFRVTVAGNVTFNGDVQFTGTNGLGGFLITATSTYTQYTDSLLPYLGIQGSGITVTISAGQAGGAGVWYQTNTTVSYFDLKQGTVSFPYYDFGGHATQNPVITVDTFTVSNATTTRAINFNGSTSLGTYMIISTLFDASVTTGLTVSNVGATLFVFNNQSNYVYDTFTGVQGTDLKDHIADVGGQWGVVLGSGAFVISSAGRVYNQSSSVAQYAVGPGLPTEDYTVEADMYAATTAIGEGGIMGRMQTGGNDYGYMWRYQPSTGNWELYKAVAGTYTLLGSSAATLTAGQTYHLKLSMIGRVITGYVDGVQKVQVTDSAVSGMYGASTFTGLRANTAAATDSTGFHFDNFNVNINNTHGSSMTFNGGGLTWGAVSVTYGKLTISGNNTLTSLTSTAGTVVTLSGSNTISSLTLNPGTSWYFGSGQTQTVTFAATPSGTSSKNISLQATTPGSQATINIGSTSFVVTWIAATDIKITGAQIVAYRSVDGGDNTNIIFVQNYQKYFTYDVYQPSSYSTPNPTFVGQFYDVITDPQFSQEVNNPGGQMSIRRAVDPTNFGEGTLVDYNNQVVVKVFSEDYINGTVIFKGFISSYTPNIEPDNQYVDIILLAYGAEFSQYLTVTDPVTDVVNGSDPSVYPAHQQSDSAVYLAQKWVAGAGATNLSSLNQIWMEVGTGFGDQSMVIEICPDDGTGNAPDRTRVMATVSGSSPPQFPSWTPALTLVPGATYYAVFHNPSLSTVNSYACHAGTSTNKLLKSSTGAAGSWSNESHTYQIADFKTYTANGNTTVAYSSANIQTTILDIISNYNIQGGQITADNTTIDDPGTTMTYTFQSNTVLEAIQKCTDLAPAGWYWYVDVTTNKLHFHKAKTTPQHYFTLGKNVASVQLQRTMETVINNVLVTGGNDGSGKNLFRNFYNAASQTRYGRRTQTYNDSNITTAAQALAVATKIIVQSKNPTSRAPVVVLSYPGGGYNIESIRPGDVFFVQGLTNSVNLQVSRIDYKAIKADLDASTIPPQINNTVQDTQNAVEQQQTNNNPSFPTQVAV